ncbi:hypothetical protein HPP05_24620 [Corallococcus exiguus]|nr:hypothetical protein [Corallococcus exiguus]NPC72934.1 hypothetical protein [Corallococcus exiguus]
MKKATQLVREVTRAAKNLTAHQVNAFIAIFLTVAMVVAFFAMLARQLT